MAEFYSHGKLLITGEYLVMSGAKALAVPLKSGQKMVVQETQGINTLHWKNYYRSSCWMDILINTCTLNIENQDGEGDLDYLQKLLKAARELNPVFLSGNKSYSVTNELEFSREWGLGSSSTLISNLAWWAGIDPFELNNIVSKGSGYDIVCARNNRPVLYSRTDKSQNVQLIDFYPDFTQNLYFIWLGNKKSTEQSIGWFQEHIQPNESDINVISSISEEIIEAREFNRFCNLLHDHNHVMEKVLKISSVQNTRFKDFRGTIKPLGAWGGDFYTCSH